MNPAYWTALFWLLLAVAFWRFGMMNLRSARKTFPLSPNRAQIKTHNGMNLGIAEHVKSHNDFVTELNSEWKDANCIAGWAQLGGAGTALVSAVTTLLTSTPT